MTKKVLAIALALIMMLCCIPFTAFADEEIVTSNERVDAWGENLETVIAELLDNEDSAHWAYVAENNEEIAKVMLTYTVFALYDDAWKNGFDHGISIKRAEDILLALIEKIDANIGESKINDVIKVLQTASDVNDLLQKVNGFVKISDTLTSDTWTKTFKYINAAIKVGKTYEQKRDEFIEIYAKIISVQAANDCYKELLTYIADTCTYPVVQTAAVNMINYIDTSVEELVKKEIAKLALGTLDSDAVLETAGRIALNSNAYTAVALKVYDGATTVADVLWNTSDQYELMDQLYAAFFVETAAVAWAKLADVKADPARYQFAIAAVLTLRETGADALYNLKLAQNKGLVGMVKNQINYNVTITEAAEQAFLALAKEVLFDFDPADYAPVKSIIQVNTTALVTIGSTQLRGATAATEITDEGYFTVVASEAAGTYFKTGFLTGNTDTVISSDDDQLVTAVIKVNEEYGINDYSFTTVTAGPNATISFDAAVIPENNVYNITDAEGNVTILNFNDTFAYPAYNAVTAQSVTAAVGNVIKIEASKKLVSIGEFIRQIFTRIIEAFKISLFKK